MHIWNQLTMSSEQERGYNKMVGNTTQLTFVTDPSFADVDGPCESSAPRQVCAPRNALPETTLYVPLQFWFCSNPGLALPLIALQYHEVKINLDFRAIDECLWAVKSLSDGVSEQKATDAYAQSLVSASLYVDYVYLDTDERRRMAQNPHEYLIEQLQHTGAESVGSSSNKIRLNFNHPVKELVWVVQPDCHVDYCSSTQSAELLSTRLSAPNLSTTPTLLMLSLTPSKLSEPTSMMVNSSLATNSKPLWLNNTLVLPPLKALNGPALVTESVLNTSGVSDAGTFVLAESSLDMHCWGENPVVTAKLQLNGQDRFSEREGTYFDQVQPWQHHTRAPDTGINVYSFALRPEEHQPSGTCNMSRIDNATLQLVLSNATVEGTNTAKVRVYARNYNVLRIMSGMGGLAYSN